MSMQEAKARTFRDLHAGEPFMIPNPWDPGLARVLEALGFRALATTSSGFAFTLGRLDGSVTLDEVIEHTAAPRPGDGTPPFRGGQPVQAVRDDELGRIVARPEDLPGLRGGLARAGRGVRRQVQYHPKYVVSSTLRDPEWTNSTVLSGDVVDEITKLKKEQDGDIVVHGSARLVQSLIENDPVDELRLIVFPVVLGTGERLFGETTDNKRLRLSSSTVVGSGVAMQVYTRT